ncbi:C25 family cysteine peptidase [Candidatus Marinimicrobia bacterium]|nr:C25 family cysteine peptidase [Candidatus Neomarinimicrobiota bacterium]
MSVFRTQFLLIISISLVIGAEIKPVSIHNGFQTLATSQEMTLHYDLPNYDLTQIEQDGDVFTKPELKDAGTIVNPGDPYLPTVSTYYAVEPGKQFSASVTIQETEIIQNVNILPLEGYHANLKGRAIAGNTYSQDALFPENIVTVSEPIIMRGLTMVQVSITPFQYNPVTNELTIIQSVDLELEESGTSEMPFIPQKRSRAFEKLYESMVVNYSSLNRDELEYQRPCILYVLPNNLTNDMEESIQELMDWKQRVGFEINEISSSTVVNDKNNLKDYIENAYETWDNPPVHVTIVGDAEGSYDIPTWTEPWSGYNENDGDHPYSTLEGSDNFPEVFLGRLSFDTSSQLATIVSKTVNYESNPYMGENWFQRACLVGDPSSSGISTVITNEHIDEILDLVGYNDINTIYSSPYASQMVSGISDGVSFFNYRGFWGVSGFGSGDINSTNNGFMLPVATVLTCGTGSFGSEECLTESFLRAGTPTVPKGAVACIGTATIGTHTMYNNLVDMGFYYGTLIEGIESAGASLMYGKMMLYQTYPSNPSNWCDIFTHWNSLMGESSLMMWTDYPTQTTVSHLYAITKGTNYIDITVSKDNGNVDGAWVTILMDDEIFESGYTNNQGFVRLPVASSQTGDVLVTVTKRNHYPYQSSFQIYDPGVSINLSETTLNIIDDNTGESVGNGDGIVNGGETIEIYISASNFGSIDAENVVGTLSSESGHVTLINYSIDYGSISSGGTVNAPTPFLINLAEGLPDNSNLNLIVNFTVNNAENSSGLLNVNISGNNLFASDIDVIGSTNDVLTVGGTSNFKIELKNLGSTHASTVTGTIACASPYVEILDNEGFWSSVMSGNDAYNGSNYFEVSTLESSIPGTIVHFILNVSTPLGYVSNSVIEVQIGTPTITDPMGPDAYGYYIYDSGDIGYTISPTYNWVEVDSRYGGSGTHLSSLTDNGNNGDDVETISLPFTFKFYGQEYDEISVCSNGWLSMGESSLESFRNYRIPGVGGPSSMVAVFWDDLQLTNNGRVYTWYDANNNKFYIQWSRVRTYQNNSTETFQAVLMDPLFYGTPTSDGEILLQYMEFNNTSYTSGSTNHGNYCTVGTEDQTMTMGLQYTFNDSYNPAAMELSNGTSLLITTRGSGIRILGDLNYDEKVNIDDVLILVDYNLGYMGQTNSFFADINEDGLVNIMDMVALIRIVLGYAS